MWEEVFKKAAEGADWDTIAGEAKKARKVEKIGEDGVFVGDTLYLWSQREDS